MISMALTVVALFLLGYVARLVFFDSTGHLRARWRRTSSRPVTVQHPGRDSQRDRVRSSGTSTQARITFTGMPNLDTDDPHTGEPEVDGAWTALDQLQLDRLLRDGDPRGRRTHRERPER